MDPEIDLPRWPRHNVYADTETFLHIPGGLRPWEYKDLPEYRQTMEISENVPWLLCWSFKSLKRAKNTDNKFFVGGGWVNDFSIIWEKAHVELFEDLATIYRTKRVPVLYFHNASFDISALMHIWKILDPNLICYTYVKSDNKNFLRGVLHSPKYNFKCELGDTMLHEMISIEAIGAALGKPKGTDVPYTVCNARIEGPNLIYTDLIDGEEKSYPLKNYIEYCIRDVEICREYGESLKEKKDLIAKTVIEDPISYEKVRPKLKGLTQGSFAKELTDVYLMQSGFRGGIDGHFRFDIPEELDQLYQETVMSNMGGYTTFNKDIRRYECKADESIYVFDCNSEYPYILTQYIPLREPLDRPPEDYTYTTWYVVSFKSCVWKPHMSSLMWGPVSTEKMNSRFETRFYMLKEYYEFIDKHCNHVSTVHEIKYQRTTNIFKPFIDRLYSLRKTYKQSMSLINKDSREYGILDKQQHGCKIIMNSIYGKLCEKSHKEGCFYYSKTTKYKTFINKKAPLKCILSGSFITYSGRLLLLDKIEKCINSGFTVLYSDTDSVMFVSKKNDPKIKEIFGEETGELGEWKCEGEFNLFLNSGVKKKYCLLDTNKPSNYKIAWSGINKAVPKAFKKRLDTDDIETINDLEYIFNPKQNVIFRRQKRTRAMNITYHQKIIYDTDFQMNKDIGKITGECFILDGEYVLEKYAEE